jgi:hypothetical protein
MITYARGRHTGTRRTCADRNPARDGSESVRFDGSRTGRVRCIPLASMRNGRSWLLAIAMLVAIPMLRVAAAQPVAQAQAQAIDESGRTDAPETDSTARVVARTVLLLPKMVVVVVLAPVQALVWTIDRYQLVERYFGLFWNSDRTFAITPSAYYATGQGFTAGGQLISKDTFGEDERLDIYALWGGSYRLRLGASIDSGNRFGRLFLEAAGGLHRLPSNPFFGIGNDDESSPPPNGMLIGPRTAAVETFHRYQIGFVNAGATLRLIDRLSAVVRGAFVDLKTTPSTNKDPSIQDVYAPMTLVGFDQSLQQLYAQGGLRWDSRGAGTRWEPQHLHTVGTYFEGFAGYVRGLDQASSFWRYGFDAQQYFRLAPGPRLLELRLYGEGVTGEIDQVPFTELPHLGGDFLRGYVYDRFRDRVAAFATVQYSWDISTYSGVYLFTDVGRVWASLDDLTLHGLRAGFGPGLRVHTRDNFVFEASLGFSIDGDVTISLALTPIADRRAHWW